MSERYNKPKLLRTDQIRRHLEQNVWDEEDEKRYVVVIVVHVKICFETLDPCIADIGSCDTSVCVQRVGRSAYCQGRRGGRAQTMAEGHKDRIFVAISSRRQHRYGFLQCR